MAEEEEKGLAARKRASFWARISITRCKLDGGAVIASAKHANNL